MPRLSNDRREALCRHYVTHWSKEKAWKQAGYAPGGGVGQVFALPEIQARILELRDAVLKVADINAQRVMLELGRVAFADVRELFTEDGQLRPVHELGDDAAATVSGIEIEERRIVNKRVRVPVLDLVTGEQEIDADGKPVFEPEVTQVRVAKIKRTDKNPALATLAKHFKLIGDEGDGVSALASALADRLKSARKRVTPKDPE
jgi:hypothetical protein